MVCWVSRFIKNTPKRTLSKTLCGRLRPLDYAGGAAKNTHVSGHPVAPHLRALRHHHNSTFRELRLDYRGLCLDCHVLSLDCHGLCLDDRGLCLDYHGWCLDYCGLCLDSRGLCWAATATFLSHNPSAFSVWEATPFVIHRKGVQKWRPSSLAEIRSRIECAAQYFSFHRINRLAHILYIYI